MNARLLAPAAAALLALATAACASTTNGHGAGPTGAASSSSPHDFPSQSTTPPAPASPQATSASPVSTSPSAPPPSRTVTVQGTTSGRKITANVYASDDLTTCAGHAYGGPMIAFLRKYPCIHAHRVLSTVVVNGRTAVLSAVDVSFGPIGQDPYAAAGRFIKLERANNTGSINDLLREGHAIPGIASSIPSNEVFQVVGQDNSATVLDAWYADGTTDPHDPALRDLETDVFLTPLS